MHISEGVLSLPVLLTGAGLTVIGTAWALKKLDYNQIPKTAILSAVFFVASLIHVPIGPSNMHLVLNGLTGIILGPACILAILVALFLQAVLFQFGGLTALGVNTVIMAGPALVCGLLYYSLPVKLKKNIFVNFCLGALGILGSGFLVAISLAFSGEAFLPAAKLIILAHIPVMVVEGIIASLTVSFLHKVRPEMIEKR
ncbi:cobalt transporter CbiM [Desulfohalobiaceae bacterium Ax17]|jgi:cobalt/nickel transport system permease protein|uniref:cobalt transporter CbiM n=1 Tax=Desulfovulcanus ferrireducens TaxID=2831190 RepID=UPI00207BBA53|nr:cobalt transporter CbiM [Desulfovulcanus ferrireducens]MBT8762710.1 cobalt transporter CbiM [Desulfovulcanus ferrireducens]